MNYVLKLGLLGCAIALLGSACSPTPVAIRVEQEKYILEGEGAEGQLIAHAVDKDGTPIPAAEMTFFCESNKIVRVTPSGALKAVSSGEDVVEIEVVGTDLKVKVVVRVKISAGVETSHEKLRLWLGQEKIDVSAWVVSEKGAYIEGYLPEWSSDDPSIVSVVGVPEPIGDPIRERSYVKMVGLKSGDTNITASYKSFTKDIRVRVYAEDENVNLAGQRLDKHGNPIMPKESDDDDDD
ncbi:MAG: hypothetical protein M0R76_09245 [Proteobacteria bacterium]|nr:hypothetical protein [Pseudomonadota bacterium]